MQTFDDWYETYERDGGELMLFNSIDLQAAWSAAWNASKIATIEAMQNLGVAE